MLTLIIGIVVVVFSRSAYSQAWPCSCGAEQPGSTNTEGKEFLLVYMQNEQPGYDPDTNVTAYDDLYIASMNATPTNVVVTCKAYPTDTLYITLPPNSSTVKRFPRAFKGKSVEMVGGGEVDPRVVKVVADYPIICYGMNHKNVSGDAFIALPKGVAGTTYGVMSYPSSTNDVASYNLSGEFAIAAFDDNTTVTITPTCDVPTSNGIQPANTPFQVVLNAGEGYQVQTDPKVDCDLTGSKVVANRPIVVYGGHVRTEAPHNFIFLDNRGSNTTSRDHLAEALPPIGAWGTRFIATNFVYSNSQPRKFGDPLRILASPFAVKSGDIYINGKFAVTLAPGQVFDTVIDSSPLNPSGNIFAIESKPRPGSRDSIPLLVASIANTGDSLLGDPFLAIVPPINQFYNEFPYFVSNDPVYTVNYSLIVTESSGAGKITITDVNNNTITPPVSKYVPATPFISGGKNYSVAWIPQTGGAYRIKTPNGKDEGLALLVYGFGSADSYGYMAGSLFAPMSIVAKNANTKTIAGNQLPAYSIENVLQYPVLLDSIRMEYSSNPEQIEVKATNVPMTYPGMLEMAGHQYVQFAPVTVPKEPIVGEAVVYYHSGNWMRMQPLHLPIEIAPGTQMSVARMAVAPAVQVSPNPSVNGVTMLRFSLSESAKGSLKVYDALGRQMPFSFEGLLGEGENSLPIITRGFAKGIYHFQLNIPDQGVLSKGQFIVE